MAADRREGVSRQRVLCLRRFRGFAPKYPTTFEKVDETFVFLHSLEYSLWTLLPQDSLLRNAQKHDKIWEIMIYNA